MKCQFFSASPLNMPVKYSWVAQLCSTLCDPMDCSIPGFPVQHHLPELAQTHVHRIGNDIQPSHPPAFNLSQHQASGSFPMSRWPRYWSFSFSISPSSEYSALISFRIDWLDLLAGEYTCSSGQFGGFPGGSRTSQVALVVKNPPANAGDIKRCGFDLWIKKIHWRRAWQPTPVFLPGESVGRGAWWATVHGVTQSRTWLSD